MTPGPPHCVANAPPTTSPIAPSPAATPEAEPWTPASTRPESTQTPWRHRPRGPDAPAPSLNPENELGLVGQPILPPPRRLQLHPQRIPLWSSSPPLRLPRELPLHLHQTLPQAPHL
ncbi:hypothetical protein E4T56_gene12030 [Termitomyces sp. T112]|nr:hypothetical protein E4T56_gene12030 [Termitomyces sp. T112]